MKEYFKRPWIWILAITGLSIFILFLPNLFPAKLYRVFPDQFFLIFHSLIELICIIFSLQIFILSWITFGKTQNPRSLFLGTSFLGVAILVALHILTFPGMPGWFSRGLMQTPLYYSFWARLWAMGALLAASFLPTRQEPAPYGILPANLPLLSSRPFLLGASLVFLALLIGLETYGGQYIPPLYTAGEGQTPLKILLEYLIIALALAAFFSYRRLYLKEPGKSLPYIMLGLILTILGEICFTFYGSYQDTYIFLGHIYIILAFGLFFQALFVSEIRLPYLSIEAAHKNLKESEEKYRQLIQSAGDAIFIADAETGFLLEANPQAEKLIGLPREKIVGMHQSQLHPPEEEEFYRQRFREAVQEGKGIITEGIQVCHQDGRRIPVEVSVNVFELRGKKVIQGICRDLTERHRAEEVMHLLYTLTQAISQAKDLHAAMEITLQKVCEATGWVYGECWLPSPEGSYLELFPAWYGRRPGLEKFHQASEAFKFPPGIGLPGRAWASKKPEWREDTTVDHGFLRPDLAREAGLRAGLAIPILDSREVVAVMVYFVTEPRQEDQKLMELTSTVAAQLGTLIRRQQAQTELEHSYDVQTALNAIMQFSLEEIPLEAVLQRTLEITLALPWLAFEARGGLFLTENDSEVLILKAQKGFAEPQQESCARVPFGKCLCGQAALTRKIQYADHIDERHEIQYQGIHPHGHYCVPICLGDEALGVLNMYLKEGHPRDEREIAFLEAVAHTLAGIIQRKKTEEALRKSEARRARAQEIAQLGNWDRHFQTNQLYWSDEVYRIFGLKPQEFGATYEAFLNIVHPDDRKLVKASFQEALDRKKPYNIEHRIVLPDGMVRFLHEQAEVYFDDSGKPLRMVGTVQDITERKHLEAQLLQSQKMEAVGTLAGGVAHDFNNLLTAMIVNLELAKAKLIKGESHEAHLEEIDNVIQRAATLTRQLLAFSRRQIIQPVPLNLNDTVTGMSKMLPRLLGEHIELDLRLTGNLARIKADPGQMEQVIMNLCVNARDAMPEGGKLILATKNISLQEDYIDHHPYVEKGDYVLLEVADTGFGMEEAVKERIFEPFFTTKEVGKGTGLGLSMVFGIIKQHEGYIDVYSEPGQGTAFKIYLPRVEEPVVGEEVKEAPRKIVGGQETILLAEDEDNLREAIRNILEMFGYTVLLAKDGQEAIEVYERDKERIDLVILDAVMPKMGGMEVADFIYKINPSQKILFSSGYSVEGIHEKFVIPANMHFIQKPYRAQELAQKVREVLEG